MPDTPKNWAREVSTIDLVVLMLRFVGALTIVLLIASIPLALVRIVMAFVQAPG